MVRVHFPLLPGRIATDRPALASHPREASFWPQSLQDTFDSNTETDTESN